SRVRSARRGTQQAPSARASSAARSPCSPKWATTRAPSSTRARTNSPPMPPEAPVTSATLFDNFASIVDSLVAGRFLFVRGFPHRIQLHARGVTLLTRAFAHARRTGRRGETRRRGRETFLRRGTRVENVRIRLPDRRGVALSAPGEGRPRRRGALG